MGGGGEEKNLYTLIGRLYRCRILEEWTKRACRRVPPTKEWSGVKEVMWLKKRTSERKKLNDEAQASDMGLEVPSPSMVQLVETMGDSKERVLGDT